MLYQGPTEQKSKVYVYEASKVPFFSSPEGIFSLLLEREEGREERERNIDVREKHQLVASCMCPDQGQYMPQMGI